jgi:flagellar biosynthetic protein FliO
MAAISDRPAAWDGLEALPSMSRPASRDVRGTASFRRIAAIAGLLGAATVAAIGALSPLPVAGASQADGTWGAGDPIGGLNVVDLATKGIVVIVLLFITLRVLGRMQASGPKKSGRMQVLESRSLAPKASLHLVAVGERRLVVGLTPSGMVSLAELDASELEASGVELGAEATRAESGAARSAQGQFQPAFGAALNSMIAPIDSLTGRLAGLFGGGRVR